MLKIYTYIGNLIVKSLNIYKNEVTRQSNNRLLDY